jgi:putative ABC transport system permease protein
LSDIVEALPVQRAVPRVRVLPIGMVWLIAWRNLAHDPFRLMATIVGVVFSVVLMGVQIGLLLGFAETASALVDRAGADFWLASKGTRNVDMAVTMTERRRYQALGVPGIADAASLVVNFAEWKRPDGGSDSVNLVGFDLERRFGAPWSVVIGSVDDLYSPSAVMIDLLYREKLGVTHLGQIVEINGHRARVVGFTTGIRAFTQSPYIFTSLKNAQAFANIGVNRTTYVLAKQDPGADPATVREGLRRLFPMLEVWSADEFALLTQEYWLLTTGAGIALIMAAILGLIVGVVIVGQTLYAATVEHMAQYSTLRAIGADGSYLRQIVVAQALIAALIGYAIAIAITYGISAAAEGTSAAVIFPWQMAVAIFILTLGQCVLGATFSLGRLGRINPSSVFQ